MSAEDTRARLEEEYSLDANGIIQNPGRFEREPLYVAWMAELIMESAADEVLSDENDRQLDVFIVDQEMREAFPEVGDAEVIVVEVDDQGFYRHRSMSKQALEALRDELDRISAPEY